MGNGCTSKIISWIKRRQALLLFSLFIATFSVVNKSYSQTGLNQMDKDSAGTIFDEEKLLHLKFSYHRTDIIEHTDDSTYIDAELSYLDTQERWQILPVEARIRGGFRRTNCYYSPIKLKIDPSKSQGTIFEGNKKFKLVFPCLNSRRSNDNLIEEYMAYKIYEVLSDYHFKTRLFDAEFFEKDKKDKNGKTETRIKGFFIQDDENFADQHNGKEINRFTDHKAQDAKSSVACALFQYMIGNTDFSTVYLHNTKLFYIDKKYVPVPYDFDMSGLVNASYAVVSNIQNETLPIDNVTSRLYRGFLADDNIVQQVREEFLDKEIDVFQRIDSLKKYFLYPKDFERSRDYVSDFYDTLADDKKFKRRITNMARSK